MELKLEMTNKSIYYVGKAAAQSGSPIAAHAQLHLSWKTEYLWIQRVQRLLIGASGCVSCVMFRGRCLRALIRVLRAVCGSTSRSGAVRVRSVLLNHGRRKPLRIQASRTLSGIFCGTAQLSWLFFKLKYLRNKTALTSRWKQRGFGNNRRLELETEDGE